MCLKTFTGSGIPFQSQWFAVFLHPSWKGWGVGGVNLCIASGWEREWARERSLNEPFQDDSFSTFHPKRTLHSRASVHSDENYCVLYFSKSMKAHFPAECPSNSSFHQRNNTPIHSLTLLMFQVPNIIYAFNSDNHHVTYRYSWLLFTIRSHI